MSSSPTDIVLVPGGWHTPSSYRKFTTALSAAFPSLRITVLPLPSITNDPSPIADYYTDTTFVRSSVSSMIAQGRRLAILMHSYGGHVGSNALANLPHHIHPSQNGGGITHLIYLAAALLPPQTLMSVPYGDDRPNETLVDWDDFGFMEGGRVKALRPVEMWIRWPGSSTSSDLERDRGEATEEEIQEYLKTIIPISARVFSQRSEEAAWMGGRKIRREREGKEENGEEGKEAMGPGRENEDGKGGEGGPDVVYVMCTKDTAVPYELQEWMVERARGKGVDVQVRKLETGHIPMLTKTGELVKILEEFLGE
ncbi:hypothetical protein B0T20DRAFT_389436 [Sordaria brevicollis]|uniref:AB hydrolase-1 domain-containing protein n=1 Tax=Sordaria brevicollis TaxID=83679 RepID=A0AAE0UF36_SORBR|nr:hypothetical protein B0T20DRAFT_389436 [Sordaria brevicollis]